MPISQMTLLTVAAWLNDLASEVHKLNSTVASPMMTANPQARLARLAKLIRDLDEHASVAQRQATDAIFKDEGYPEPGSTPWVDGGAFKI